MTTIDEIYAAINPLPAMLSEKGKVKPCVSFRIEANADFNISMNWKNPYAYNDWELEYEHVSGNTFAEVIDKTLALIRDMPSAEQAKLTHFMGKLGKLIDAGKDDGIEVDYLSPLLDTMKRLSENVITYQPHAR